MRRCELRTKRFFSPASMYLTKDLVVDVLRVGLSVWLVGWEVTDAGSH